MPSDLTLQIGAGPARIVLVLLLFGAGSWVAGARRAGAAADSRVLVVLRLAALSALALLLLDPTLVVERTRAARPRVVVAVDRSLSMSLPAEAGGSEGETRLERAARAMESSGLLDRLRDGADVEYVTFGGRPRRVSGDSLFTGGPIPSAGRTDLARALAWIPGHVPDADAVVVVTDGRVNEGADPATALRALPRTLFLGLGRGEGRRDGDLVALRAPGTVFEGGPVPFDVTVRSVGGGADSLRLVVAEGARTIRRIPLEPGGGGGFRDLHVSLADEPPGRHEYEFRLEGAADDAFPDNDRRLAVVQIEPSRTDVLVVSGAPRWDLTFFVDALTRLEYLRIDRLLLDPGGATGRLMPADGSPARGVSIGDIDPGLYALLCFQGGPIPGGLLMSPVSATDPSGASGRGILLLLTDPVSAVPARGVPLPPWIPPSLREGKRFREGAFEVDPPAGGELRISAARAAWESLPPLSAAVDLPPGATPLDGAPPLITVREDGRRWPAVVRKTHGSTRVVMLLGRGYWRWAFHPAPIDGVGRLYSELVDALVRWALASGPASESLRLTPATPLFERGETVAFLRSGAMPFPGGLFVAVTADRAGAPPDSFFFDATAGPVSTRPYAPGEWRYEYGVRGEAAMGRGRFTVDSYSAEYSEPEPDGGRLAALGESRGAAYLDMRSVRDQIQGKLRALGRIRRTDSKNYVVMYSPIVYVVALISLIAEILARKRRGFS